MWLEEWQGKAWLHRWGITVPRGKLAGSPPEAEGVARELGTPVMVKAQGPFLGRGKAGLVRAAVTPEEAGCAAADLLGRRHDGRRLDRVLIEEQVPLVMEAYLGVAVDLLHGQPILLASRQGGVDVEAEASALARMTWPPGEPLAPGALTQLIRQAGFEEASEQGLHEIAACAYAGFCKIEAELVEINPLALTARGDWVALDARVIVDDHALARHPELQATLPEGRSSREEAASAEAASYWELPGDVAYLTTGAGLALILHDAISELGGRPANFFDPGFSMGQGKTRRLMELLLARAREDRRVRAIIVVLYIGGADPEEVAGGVAAAIRAGRPTVPIFGLTGGRGSRAMAEILEAAGVSVQPGLREIVETAVAAAKVGTGGHPA